MYIWSVNLVLLPSLCAFLLEPINQQSSSKGQLVSSNHYLTVSRFLEAQKQQQSNLEEQHRNTEALRKSVDETFALLTSQLQGKFVDFERKLINDVTQNETGRVVAELEIQILELKKNYTIVLSELQIAKDENKRMKDTLSLLKNETHHVAERVNNIEQLKNIQSLQELQVVKQQIQTINSQTASLSQSQFARNQDFLALYNQTSVGLVQADNRLKHLESFRNVLLTNATIIQQHFTHRFVEMEGRLQHFEEYRNISLTNTAALQTQITNNTRKVAITSCQADNQKQSSGYIVKFGNVKTSIGISDISSFKRTGKFKCEYEGLYSVSVSLTAYNTLINYGIYLNGNKYTAVVELDNKVYLQRGTTSVIVNLQPNDMLWVQLLDNMYVDIQNSCIAIALIK